MMDNFGTLHIYITFINYIYTYIYIDKGYISLDMRRGYTYMVRNTTSNATLGWEVHL